MVEQMLLEPIFLIVIALGAAFSLGLFKKSGEKLQIVITLGALFAMTIISGLWAKALIFGGVADYNVYTAGLKPPFSINLLMGKSEAVLTLIVNLSALLSATYLIKAVKEKSVYMLMLLLVFTMGLNGVILTRDLFNLFVFIEVASIASAGLIALKNDIKQLSAGFKYVIAGAIASAFMLLGIIFNYYTTGSLNIDIITTNMSPALASTGFAGIFLIFIGIIIELKPFPINGWGLDAYEASVPAVSALIASATATAMFYAFTKVMAVTGGIFLNASATIGAITFLGSNLAALKQENSRRLLGYSSIAQVGLLVFAYSMMTMLNMPNVKFVVFGLLVTHALSKAGLFWLSGIVGRDSIKEWGITRKNPLIIGLFIIFIFALVGFPPFPSFFAKWELVMQLALKGNFIIMGVILVASLIEAVYLFRWLGYALKLDEGKKFELNFSINKIIPPVIYGVLILALGYFYLVSTEYSKGIDIYPVLFILGLALIDFLPVKIKNTIALSGLAIYSYFIFPTFFGDLFRTIFGALFMGGGLLTLFSGYYHKKDRRAGFYPAALAMFAGLIMLVEASNLFELLYAWEIMTAGSYFLLIRGKKSMPHGYSYMLFSIGGAYAMMAGFSMAFVSAGTLDLSALTDISVYPLVAYSLMLLGFMTKTASIGLHIWLPGAHGEAVADIHFMASAILLKAGVFGMILVLLGMGSSADYAKIILSALLWIGAITALIANANAAFQESAKRLLAWSSIGQLGYITFALATMSHIGWIVALSLAITHFLYKGILFMVIGGVSLKLGTPMMYKMGGLIKRMPFSFFAVLIAIITLSGVPPLVGYTGKWMMYNVIISGEYFATGLIISISGLIAFLYLFRMIFTMFLGQLKDEHRKVGEISIWFLIPVYALLAYIIYVSFFPGTLLSPIGNGLAKIPVLSGDVLEWSGRYASTSLGYFNGNLIMYVFLGIFGTAFAWLLIVNRKAQRVKQFNIVYSAERPERPETSHFSYNFFAPYRRAVGFLEYPLTIKFWDSITEGLHTIGDFLRRIYSGNGQTYLLQIIIFVVITFVLTNGGK